MVDENWKNEVEWIKKEKIWTARSRAVAEARKTTA